jgi:hypothetical protein
MAASPCPASTAFYRVENTYMPGTSARVGQTSCAEASRRDQNRIPPPQAVIGQVRATPPAIDRVVTAEVFLVRDNRLAKFGQRQPASLVGRVTVPIIIPPERAQFVVEARYSRPRSVREPFQQGSDFRGAEYTPLAERLKVKERIRERVSPRDQLKQPHFRRAKPRHAGGKLLEQVQQGRLEQRQALKSLLSKSKQACGVVARYACQVMLAVSSSSFVTSTSGTFHLPSSSAVAVIRS